MSPEQKEKVTLVVPTEIEVDASRLEGDMKSGIRFEVKSGEQQAPRVRELLNRGARVFVTEEDRYLIIHPKTE